MPIFQQVTWSVPKARRKLLAAVAAGVLFSVMGIYKLLNGAYMDAIGSAGLGFIYLWLALKHVGRLDDNLEQSLSEVSDALPDIDDTQNHF
jgi:hypothetical protein